MSVVIESGFTGIAQPLNHPRIAAFPASGTVAVSTAAAGFPGVDASDGQTWTFWRPTAVPATWTLTFSSQTISYFAIAGHDMATVGASVDFQRWNGSAWVTVASHTPTDNGPILLLATARTMDRARFNFTGAVPTIAVMAVGNVTEFPQGSEYVDSVPFNEVSANEFRDTISDGGHVLQRFATRRAGQASMTVRHLPESFMPTLTALRAHMEGEPVFMADRPVDYPNSVAFGLSVEPFMAQRAIPQATAARSVTIRLGIYGPAA